MTSLPALRLSFSTPLDYLPHTHCIQLERLARQYLLSFKLCNYHFLTELFNRSLTTGCVPAVFKTAYISPRLKKVDLDSSDVRSYHPISNLSILSKLLEILVTRQLLAHLNSNGLLPKLQSAHRANHSTETAVQKGLTIILLAVDAGNLSAVVLLDLSAAFDTVDHGILLHRLNSSYQIVGSVQPWFQSYLSKQHQHVRIG